MTISSNTTSSYPPTVADQHVARGVSGDDSSSTSSSARQERTSAERWANEPTTAERWAGESTTSEQLSGSTEVSAQTGQRSNESSQDVIFGLPDEPLVTITVPAPRNNEVHLNNGVVVDVEEATGEPAADTIVEIRPDSGEDDPTLARGTTGVGLAMSLADRVGLPSHPYVTAAGAVVATVGAAATFFDIDIVRGEEERGHFSPQRDSPDPRDAHEPGMSGHPGGGSAQSGN